MIQTPDRVQTGEHVAAAAARYPAVKAWQEALGRLGRLSAAEEELQARLASPRARSITVPLLRVVVTDLELFSARCAEGPDKAVIEGAINAYLLAHLAGDEQARLQLEHLGPDGGWQDKHGCYLVFEGAPRVEELA